MSLVWTIIATFLYAEIILVLLFVLPIASPQRWQRFFKSRFLAMLANQAQVYFYLLLAILVLFLLEAIREMRKYNTNEQTSESHFNELQHSMRLFRAQRNFYISGFAIFLVLVIRRLVTLITSQAQLLAQAEASLKQAQSATSAARAMMGEKKAKVDDAVEATEDKTVELKTKVKDLEEELRRANKDKEAMKSQAESLNREYDRLTDEYSKLQRKVVISGGGSHDKDD